MKLDYKKIDGVIKIVIPQNFAIEEASSFREEVYGLIKDGEKRFFLNFSNCDFIDSTGLGVMVGVYKKCMEMGGSFKLSAVKPQVMKVLSLTRLDKVFDIM